MDPFTSLSSIFLKIRQKSLLLKNENETTIKISSLNLQIISYLKHPREKRLKASNFFELTQEIIQLRNSPVWKDNYANCKSSVQKIEEAMNKYGKRSFVGSSSIDKYFKNDSSTRQNLNVLIETFKESENDKVPLLIVYKLQNLPVIHHPKAISILVSMLHKVPNNKLEYLDLLLNHLEAGDAHFLHELNKKSDGGFNLLKNSSPILFAFNKPKTNQFPFFNTSEPAIHKLFILKTMALFIDTDQTPDITDFIELLNNKTLDRSEHDLLKILARIPTEKRIPALQHAVKFFSSDLGIWEKFTYVLEVSLSPECKGDPLKIATLFKNLSFHHYLISVENIPYLSIDNKFREELIEDSLKIYSSTNGSDRLGLLFDIYYRSTEQNHNKNACQILNIIYKIKISREHRLSRLKEIEKLYAYFPYTLEGREIAHALYALSQTLDDADMRDAMQSMHRLFKEDLIDLFKSDVIVQPYTMITAIPKEERDPFIDSVIKAAKYLSDYFGNMTDFEKKDLLAVMLLLSKDEQKLLLEILPEATFICEHFPFHLSHNFAFEFSLFLIAIKSDEQLIQDLKAGTLTLSRNEYIDKILDCASKKIHNIQNTPKEALLALCHYLYNDQGAFNLFEEHPITLQVMDFFSLADSQDSKSPFVLYKKLLELSNQPVTFQPQPVNISGSNVRFNMKAFEAMSLDSLILREDIPKEATLEAFNLLLTNLSNKYALDPSTFKAALKKLNPDLSWTVLSLNGPLITLRGLLTLSHDHVSDVEAKWRFILANILSKSTEDQKNSFFTEQERVLITTQYVIQACSIGIRGGIEDAYQSLSREYKTKCLSTKANSVIMQEENQIAAHIYLENWMKQYPDTSFDDLSLLLVKESLHDSLTISKQLFSLIGYDLSLWDVTSKFEEDPLDDPLAEWHLNLKGAKTALHATLKTQEQVNKVLIPILRDYIEGLFNRGNDAVIKHFVGNIEIQQGVHQALYIRNLIGHIVGLSKHITLDPHANNIYEELMNVSVNEMMEVFFDKHPLKHFIKEVFRVINQEPETYKKALPSYFDRPEFWTVKGALTLQGALELFIQSGFMVIS